jgi:hypothetical protein
VLDLKLGLFGSPYPKLAIDILRQGISDPDHAITEDFLWTLVRLEINNDPAWKPPPMDTANQQQIRTFSDAYQAHDRELTSEAIKLALASLPAKTPLARAVTLNGMIEARMEWLTSPPEAFAGRTPQQLIADGRIRDLVVEFERLREGQPV